MDNNESENLLQRKSQDQVFGHNLLNFLNNKEVIPPYTEETMGIHTAWQSCCKLALMLSKGELVIAKSSALPAAMEAAKNAAIKVAKEKQELKLKEKKKKTPKKAKTPKKTKGSKKRKI